MRIAKLESSMPVRPVRRSISAKPSIRANAIRGVAPSSGPAPLGVPLAKPACLTAPTARTHTRASRAPAEVRLIVTHGETARPRSIVSIGGLASSFRRPSPPESRFRGVT
jgi:hypothetical protein